jgi:protein TonB
MPWLGRAPSRGPQRHEPSRGSLLSGRNRARWTAGVIVSIAAHVAMFGGALLYAQLTPPHTVAQQPIMAHLVRLGHPPDPKLLPRLPAPTRAPEAPHKPDAHPSVPAPVVAEPAKVPKPDVDEEEAPESDPSKRDAQRAHEALQRQKRLAEALAKLGAPTDDRTSPKGEAPVGQADGDAAGTADKAAEGDRYAALVQEALKRNFIVPTTISEKERLYLFSTLRIFIAADGKITRFKIDKASGNTLYDRAVEETLERTGNLPPPPASLAKTYAGDGLGVRFKP